MSRSPNSQLLALYGEAGYTEYGQLVRDLERRSSRLRCGTVRVDDTTVSRWLMEGQQPRTLQVRRLVASVLTGRLGRLVTPADLGWADPLNDVSGRGLTYSSSLQTTLETLGDLVRGESIGDRRALMSAAAVSVSAFTAAAWRWMTAQPDRPRTGDPGSSAVAVEIRSMTTSLRSMGDAQGSGAVRPAAIGYLQHVLENHLAGAVSGTAPGAVSGTASVTAPTPEPASWTAVAGLTDLVAWLCADAGLGSLAQRYEVQALRLSRAADDTPMGGWILAEMSRQSLDNGGLREAVELSTAGRLAIDASETPVLAAVLRTREARAHARLAAEGVADSAARARRALDSAAELLQGPQRPGGHEPYEVETFAETDYPAQRAHVLRDLGDETEAEPLALAFLARTPDTAPVRQSMGASLLASIYLAKGELDQAVGAADRALLLASGVQSVQASVQVRGIADRFARYAREPQVKAFLDRVKETLPAA